jgi:uncharacterized membrane protein YcaP (DUF421 family)
MSLVIRAACAYFILLFAVRLIGRRTASMMAPFDYIVLFMFAGITVTAVLGDDKSMAGAFSAVCTIGLMHVGVSLAKERWDWFGRLVDGTPVIIFEHGAFIEKRMRMLRLQPQDVMAACRQRGLRRLDQVRYAVAERDGKVSIIEKHADEAASGDGASDDDNAEPRQSLRQREAVEE